jgi:2,4-dienoyl-CoA reductase-like NADH-dependent reductase (Old Yellow Enzyme family)
MKAPREPLQIAHAGRVFNGSYRVEDGCVQVESAYGSRIAEIGPRRSDPRPVAERALRELVEAWSAARRQAGASSAGFGRRELRLH